MARLWDSGFELQTTTANVEIDARTGIPAVDTTLFRSGLASLQMAPAASVVYETHVFTATTSNNVFARVYANFTSFPASGSIAFVVLRSAAAGNNLILRIGSTGTIVMTNEQAAGVQVGSASSAMSTGTWYRIELSYINSTGAANAYLDGVNFATGTANTAVATDTLRFGVVDTTTMTVNYDDVAVNDQTGTAQTGLPGSGKIITLKPNAAGDANTFATQTGGTVGAANNFTRVQEITPDDATTFNGSSTLNETDMFNMDNSGIGASDTVNVVSVHVRHRNSTADPTAVLTTQIEKTASGTISQSAAIIPNSTTFKTDKSASPFVSGLVLYLDPDGSAWTQTTLDSMQAGYKLTTGPGTAGRRIDVSKIWVNIDYTPSAGPPAPSPANDPAMYIRQNVIASNNIKPVIADY